MSMWRTGIIHPPPAPPRRPPQPPAPPPAPPRPPPPPRQSRHNVADPAAPCGDRDPPPAERRDQRPQSVAHSRGDIGNARPREGLRPLHQRRPGGGGSQR